MSLAAWDMVGGCRWVRLWWSGWEGVVRRDVGERAVVESAVERSMSDGVRAVVQIILSVLIQRWVTAFVVTTSGPGDRASCFTRQGRRSLRPARSRPAQPDPIPGPPRAAEQPRPARWQLDPSTRQVRRSLTFSSSRPFPAVHPHHSSRPHPPCGPIQTRLETDLRLTCMRIHAGVRCLLCQPVAPPTACYIDLDSTSL